MAHTPGTQARTQRLITAAATVSLAVATAFALGRVFQGARSTDKLILVAVASALVACALERRNLLLATLVSAAALLLVVGWLLMPHTMRFGLPTAATLHAIVAASRQVGEQARIQVAPSVPTVPLMLAALTATWAAVFSAHALAFRAGSPLLALLPPLALLAFADTVLDQFVRPLYGLVFLAAALFVIFADGLRRLQGWGPVWTGPGRDARLARTAGRGARGVIASALGLALIAPALIPGFGSKAILELPHQDTGSVRIDPFVDIGSALRQSSTKTVFTVTTARPTYYQFATFSSFNGAGWGAQPGTDSTIPLTSQTLLNPNIDLSPAQQRSATVVKQQFSVAAEIIDPWLPYGYPAQSIDIAHPITWDPSTAMASYGGPIEPGATYSADAMVLSPTPKDLEALVSYRGAAQYTDLPPDLDKRIGELAAQWTAGDTTTYDKVISIQNHLATEFHYSTTVGTRDSQTALSDFLLHDRRGFCVQFAGAMAVMLRTLKIPARVAVGFDYGTRNGTTDTWTVTNKDAHAWPEVLFPRYGWLPFEPTPGKVVPDAEAAYVAPVAHTQQGRGTRPPTCPRGVKDCKGHPTQRNNPALTKLHNADPHRFFGDLAPLELQRSWWRDGRHLLLAGVLIALLALLCIPPVRAWRRRARLRRAAAEPRGLILATYDVFTERAAELGFPRDPGETPEEYRRRVVGSGLLHDGDLDRLTAITVSAAYAPREPAEADAVAARDSATRTLIDLRKGTPFIRRLRGRYALRR